MKFKKKGFVAGAVVGASVAAAAMAGTGLQWSTAAADAQPGIIKAAAPVFAPPPGAPLSFADIFQRVAPAVVSIDVTTRSRAPQAAMSPFQGMPGFPFQMPDQGDDEDGGPGGQAPGARPQGRQAQATGSGFLISADGYIVTNNHVVENAEKITVRLNDERELTARLIGRDEGTDLAVIKVEGRGLPFVNFERDAKPRVGDWVIAVGNPFNLGGTATAGIISAYGRDIGETYTDYLQIDAPINRGNSGGPTFDVYGRVIGVNTAIFSPTGGSVGIGFAIPADIADNITKQLISGGKITRGFLGVTVQNITPEVAESLGVKAKSGALISDVTAGGPAAKAGVQQGDIVLTVNGRSISSSTELTRAVASARAGDAIKIEVLRSGRKVPLSVISGIRPSEAELNGSSDGDQGGQTAPRAPSASVNLLGMGLGVLDSAARQRLSIPANVSGVAVESVSQNSEAGRRGLQRGDVISRVGDRAVTSPAEVSSIVEELRKQNRNAVLLLINRQGRPLFTALRLKDETTGEPIR